MGTYKSISLVPKCFECSSALRVPKYTECPSTLGVTLECPLRALRVKKISNITGNGILNSFIEFFFKFSEYMFYITVIAFCFLGNKVCKFYHVLLPRYKSFKEVSKNFLKYFVKFQKFKHDRLQSSLLSNVQLECTVLLLPLWNNWILADILAVYFLPTNACFI